VAAWASCESRRHTLAHVQSLLFSFVEIETSRVFSMPILIMFGRHHAENCPMFNEKTRKTIMKFAEKRGRLLKKHGIKELGSWTVMGEHLAVMVYEAPSLDAFEKFSMEPEFLAVNAFETVEVKLAVSNEEVAKMLPK